MCKLMEDMKNKAVAKAVAKAKIEMLIELVLEGSLSLKQAAAKAGMTEEKFTSYCTTV